jgi:endonuclease/exonuclease/phosphatase family metal-dependent hydrolase
MALGLLSFTCLPGAGCARLRVAAVPASDVCRVVVGPDRRAIPVPLRWETPPADRRVLDAWCETVGPAVVAGLPRGAEMAGDPVSALPIVSWNVHVGGGDLIALVDALRAGRLTDGKPVRHFVLLLQEAYRAGDEVPPRTRFDAGVPGWIGETPPGGTRRDIVTAAASLGLALYYVPSMRNGATAADGRAEDRGNAILSTLPLSELTAIELPFERQRRVAVAATVSGATPIGVPWHLRVSSAHLDTLGGARRLWLFAGPARARQARSLVDALAPDSPLVLGSDLNTWSEGPREAAYRELRRSFPDTPAPGIRPTFRVGLLLDYVFFRLSAGWRGEYRRIGDRFGSDHHPLLAHVRMGPDASSGHL